MAYNVGESILRKPSIPNLKDLVVTDYDKASLQHTRLPVPAQLTVKPSSLPKAGLGVFATTLISKDVRMGPYEGKKVSVEEAGKFYNTAYAWEVRLEGKRSFYIDGQDSVHSNWMRFVNPVQNRYEPNTAAYQHGKKIFYRTIKDIEPGTELLVRYAEDYAAGLGSSSQNLEELLYEQGTSYEHTLEDEIVDDHGHTVVQVIPHEQVVGDSKDVDSDSMIVSSSCVRNELEDDTELAEIDTDSSDESESSSDSSEGGLLECSSCQQNFSCEKDLQEHDCECMLDTGEENDVDSSEFPQEGVATVVINVPSEENSTLECKKCGETFFSPNLLENHMIRHAVGSQYKCPNCEMVFNTQKAWTKHCVEHEAERPYVCEYCQKDFTSKTGLRIHLRTHTGERPYKCNHCDKTFATTSGLYQHVRTHTGDKPYKCDNCGKTFGSMSNLRVHFRVHTGDRPFKCDVCEKSFSTKSTLNQHVKIHSSVKGYVCDECGKEFTHSSNLSQHRKIHSTAVVKPHKCDHCEKSFHLKSHLRQHLRMHSDARPFECVHCGKKFASNSYLVFHVKSHSGEKMYKCDLCSKAFTQKVYLKQHMKIHSDVKAYVCEQCGKSFRHQSNLSQHHKVHTEDKPFQCEVCGKAFSRRQNLRQHSRTHSKKDS